jgi:Amidohydrolase family
MRPVSARSGRKEFIEDEGLSDRSGGRSPSRGHGSALMRQGKVSGGTAAMQARRDLPMAHDEARLPGRIDQPGSKIVVLSAEAPRVPHHSDKWADYGDDRLQWMFAHKSFLDAGIPVTGASDYIPGPFEPMMAFMSMVTRKGRDGKVWGGSQRITVE